MDSGGDGNTETEITRILNQRQHVLYDGSSDGTRVAVAVLHKEEEIIIRLNNFVSVLEAEHE